MMNFTADLSNGTLDVNQASEPLKGIIEFHVGLNIFLSIVAILGNSLILVALQKVSSLYPPTKLLFRCLAVSDLLVGLVLHPLHIIGLILDYKLDKYGHGVDDISYLLGFILCGMSILVSTAISLDRLSAILLRLRYRQVVTLRRVRIALLVFLIVAVVVALIYIFVGKLSSLIMTLLLITFSVVISSVSYIMIYRKLRQHHAQIQDHHQAQANGGCTALNIARYKKTVSSIAWVQLALVFCYAPFGLCVILKINGRTGFNAGMILTFASTLIFLNSSLNPFFYCWKLRDVRQAVKASVTRYICCQSG